MANKSNNDEISGSNVRLHCGTRRVISSPQTKAVKLSARDIQQGLSRFIFVWYERHKAELMLASVASQCDTARTPQAYDVTDGIPNS